MSETGSQQASYYDTQGEEETNNVNFLQASKGEDGSDSESEVAEAGSSKVNLFSHCERGVQTTIIRNKVSCLSQSVCLSLFLPLPSFSPLCTLSLSQAITIHKGKKKQTM